MALLVCASAEMLQIMDESSNSRAAARQCGAGRLELSYSQPDFAKRTLTLQNEISQRPSQIVDSLPRRSRPLNRRRWNH